MKQSRAQNQLQPPNYRNSIITETVVHVFCRRRNVIEATSQIFYQIKFWPWFSLQGRLCVTNTRGIQATQWNEVIYRYSKKLWLTFGLEEMTVESLVVRISLHSVWFLSRLGVPNNWKFYFQSVVNLLVTLCSCLIYPFVCVVLIWLPDY